MISERMTKSYCKDFTKIENYDKAIADTTQVWECHHRLELDGIVPLSRVELISSGLYYNRPADELIFLTKEEHTRLHKKGNKSLLGKHHSEETKRKISEANKGKKFSEEHKRNLSNGMKGNKNMLGKHLSEETKKKISETRKGKPSPNKGNHLSEESRNKMSDSHRGKHWKLVDGKRIYY